MFGPQGFEIVVRNRLSWRLRLRMRVSSIFSFVTSAADKIGACGRIKLDFLQGRVGIVLDDDWIPAEVRIDSEEEIVQTDIRMILIHRARYALMKEGEHGTEINLANQTAIPGEAKNPQEWGCFAGGFRKVLRPTDVRCWQLIGYSMAR